VRQTPRKGLKVRTNPRRKSATGELRAVFFFHIIIKIIIIIIIIIIIYGEKM
jgi:hypothetical protein